jgi:hypothetical protein
MVISRPTTPARGHPPERDSNSNPGYIFCPRTGVKVHNGKSLDPASNKPSSKPDNWFCTISGQPLFNYCFRTGKLVEEVKCGKTGKYLPVTVGNDGEILKTLFCNQSGAFLGDFSPMTGKNKAHATTPGGKLVAETWDYRHNEQLPHKYCTGSGNNLNTSKLGGSSNSSSGSSKGPTKGSDDSIGSSKGSGGGKELGRKPGKSSKESSKSSSTLSSVPSSKSTSKSTAKHSSSSGSVKKPTPPIKPTKARTKVAVTAASSRPTRTAKVPARLIDAPTSHPIVKKDAPKKKKAAPKKAATKKAAPKKAAAKKPAAKKPAAKKVPAKKGAKPTGVKKTPAKPKANTKAKLAPKN